MKKLRQEFADTMLEVGPKDPRLVVLVGDISHGILQPYAAQCQGRYYNVGICEPTIVNMSAGLNKVGLIPVVHTIAPFITERAYEQIKLDFGYQNLNLNLISIGGAFDYAQLGCSHHCYTDVSLLCHLKRSTVIIPGSPRELNILFKELYDKPNINYFRLPEHPHGIELESSDIVFGKAIRIKEGSDVTIVVAGTQLKNAISAAETLAGKRISAEILYYPTIKPFDAASLRASVEKTRHLVVVEELSAHDGIFNFCLHACMGMGGIKMEHRAINDFVHGYGTYEELCAKTGLDAKGMIAACQSVLAEG